MILSDIGNYLREREYASVADIANRFDTDPEVVREMLAKGYSRDQEFEADGINVGAGGISMRASVVPQVGSTLRCQLDNPNGGEAIEMIGRVVWAHESGEHAGEFGIRFTHLSSEDQAYLR